MHRFPCRRSRLAWFVLGALLLAGLVLTLRSWPARVRICLVNRSAAPLRDVDYRYGSKTLIRGTLPPNTVREARLWAEPPPGTPRGANFSYTRADDIEREVWASWTFEPGNYGTYYVVVTEEGVWQEWKRREQAPFSLLREAPPCEVIEPVLDFFRRAERPPRAGEYPQLDDVRAHRRAWRARKIRDYVMVASVPEYARLSSPNSARLDRTARVVVLRGKVVSARGLHDDSPSPIGSTGIEYYFDEAERHAAGFPANFDISYDSKSDTVSHVSGDQSTVMAHDEFSLDVWCFSTDFGGCNPNFFSLEQCEAADGVASEPGKGCNGARLGRISSQCSCCWRGRWRGEPDLSDASCTAAGGEMRNTCQRAEAAIGKNSKTGSLCCRPWVH